MNRDGLGALVGWILGGAVVGTAIGFIAHGVVDVALTRVALAGLGAALGGGLGGLINILSLGDEEAVSDPTVTVDMAADTESGPRPADLFEDHPDPVLYVADAGGGPVVRAANDAYGATFDLPTGTLEGAPLDEALRPDGDASALLDAIAAGGTVDRESDFVTPDGTRTFRVRSVGSLEDGYLLFTRATAE